MSIYDIYGNKLSQENKSGSSVYCVTDYGITTDAEDNTPALQSLVDFVYMNGGGVIFFPIGTYNFKKATLSYAVSLKSNVSIVGENIETTILKQTEAAPYAMFDRHGSADDPLTGCCFSNFTVDAYDTGNTNAVYGKAFFVQYLRDCVFRDLRLLGTTATAMGIDFLDRVTIDNVNCVDCGRTYTGSQAGTSGIGIGTGGWEDENFTINNCICVGSGQYGIFIENQYAMNWGGNYDSPKGCVISNCIVRDGLNNGIGIRGGRNVTVIGCETYENAKHGIYLDNKCINVKIVGCSTADNGGNGVMIATTLESEKIIISGNTISENTDEGIYATPKADTLVGLILRDNNIIGNDGGVKVDKNIANLSVIGNYISGNGADSGVVFGAVALADCVVKGNILMDGYTNGATFSGNTNFNEFAIA